MKKKQFEFNELPYPTPTRSGPIQEMIEDLPLCTPREIGEGGYSPVLSMRVAGEDGEVIESCSRFAFICMDNGEVDMVFYPTLRSSPLEHYNKEQQKQLLDDKSIITGVVMADRRRSEAFVQIDGEIKQVMYIPIPITTRNLKMLVEVMYLGTVEVNGMQHGGSLMVVVDGEPVAVGINLHNKAGIHFYADDAQEWREQLKREWDRYTFGCYGCWMMGDDGNLDYVPGEGYTEELRNEQKKNGRHNRMAGIHK